MRGVDNRQQFMLEEFYKREKIWGADNYLCGFAAGIVLVIAAILLIMPVQVWEGDYGMIGYCLLLELMGMGLYIRQYCMFREDGKSKSGHGLSGGVCAGGSGYVFCLESADAASVLSGSADAFLGSRKFFTRFRYHDKIRGVTVEKSDWQIRFMQFLKQVLGKGIKGGKT